MGTTAQTLRWLYLKKCHPRAGGEPEIFINFGLAKEMLVGGMGKVGELGESYGSSDVFAGQTVIVDYSGPNIAKPFGIGHLRSTIIGQAIYNLYKFLGARVIGDNHLGDWGRQFGMLIAKIMSKAPTRMVNQNAKIENLTIEDLERMYVEFNKEAEERPELMDGAREWFKRLEEGDPDAREIWQKVKDISLTEFNRIYDLLGVTIDYAYGESFYEKLMPEVVEECKVRGIAKESEGALIVEFPSASSGQVLPPAILVKSDGATNYFTRDLATVKFRLKEWDPSLILYEVGAEQALHFQQLFEAVRLLGWGDPSPSSGRVVPTRFVHIKHGLYLAPSGKKFSTRKGDTVHLEEVLEEAIERARALAARGPVKSPASGPVGSSSHPTSSVAGSLRSLGGTPSAPATRTLGTSYPSNDVGVAVGVGAVKYFDLSHHPSSNIVFDWDKVMALEGNSAPYLQYTYARCKSVIANAVKQSLEIATSGSISLTIPRDDVMGSEELAVLRTFYKFPEVVEEAAKTHSPNLVCNFLFDLAQKYNAFYNQHRILPPNVDHGHQKAVIPAQAENYKDICMGSHFRGNDKFTFRLVLTQAVGNILKTGLGLLGIEAPQKM